MANDNVARANPAALGLIAFGLTTVLLSVINAGWLPPGSEYVVAPLALAFGGTVQVRAGLMEYKNGNTFAMTAFLSYGAFWWWFAALVILGHTGALDLKEAGPAIGAGLILWGIFTLYMWVGTFALSRILFLVFLTLWIAFFLLGIGKLIGRVDLTVWGGYVGVLCGLLAMYGSFAITANAAFGRQVLPLGAR
jgi:succinate-acetate transporter protein